MVGLFRDLVGGAGAALVPDDQHVALSQLQGPKPGASAVALDLLAGHHPALSDLGPFAAGAAGNGHRLRPQRHHYSRRRNHTPPPASSTPATGAPSWLTWWTVL